MPRMVRKIRGGHPRPIQMLRATRTTPHSTHTQSTITHTSPPLQHNICQTMVHDYEPRGNSGRLQTQQPTNYTMPTMRQRRARKPDTHALPLPIPPLLAQRNISNDVINTYAKQLIDVWRAAPHKDPANPPLVEIIAQSLLKEDQKQAKNRK